MTLLNNSFKTRTTISALDSTNDTDCYVVPKNFSGHVEHVLINNNNSANKHFTLKYYNKIANTTTTLISAHVITAKSSESVFTVDKPLYIHAEDKIVIAAETADTLTVVIAAKEYYSPNR